MNRSCVRMSRVRRSVAGTCIVIACAACSSSTAIKAACTAPQSVAIQLDVDDSLTGANIADSATGTVNTLTYQAALQRAGGAQPYLFGGNQLGSYTVVVQRPSYADWRKTGVKVSLEGPCGNVLPVQLTALLVRTP